MTSTNWEEDRMQCPRCGNRYLPPWREGDFGCSVCGARLPHRRGRRATRPQGVRLAVGFLGLTLLLVGARFGREVAVRQAPGPATPAAAPFQDWAREELRWAAAYRARIRRDLREKPDQSAPYAAVARDIFRTARNNADTRINPSSVATGPGPVMNTWEHQWLWQRAVEKEIATRMRGAVAPGLRHAETALRLARGAVDEVEARRARAEGLLLLGEYRKAIPEYRWLKALEPGSHVAALARCYEHLGLEVPEAIQQALMRLPVQPGPGQASPIGAEAVERTIEATRRWARRWPNDSIPQMRLGYLSFRLAIERAARRRGFPRLGRASSEEVDAFIYRQSRELVDRGVGHYRRAVALAGDSWTRARAMEELSLGLLLQGRVKEAIPTLKEALALAPDLPQARLYLRSAFRRTEGLRGAMQTGDDREYLSLGMFGLDGTPMGMGPFGLPRIRAPRRPPLAHAVAAEVRELLRIVEQTGRAWHPDTRARRQQALNRLDELLPGSATEYEAATHNVVQVDEARVRLGLDRLGTGMAGLGGPGPGGPGPGFARPPGIAGPAF